MDRGTDWGNANIHPILDVTEMNWKCTRPQCDSTSFKLLHYTPATMSTICAKCGMRNTNIGPKFPLLINSAPKAMELTITDKDLMNEVSELRREIEAIQQEMEKDAH